MCLALSEAAELVPDTAIEVAESLHKKPTSVRVLHSYHPTLVLAAKRTDALASLKSRPLWHHFDASPGPPLHLKVVTSPTAAIFLETALTDPPSKR